LLFVHQVGLFFSGVPNDLEFRSVVCAASLDSILVNLLALSKLVARFLAASGVGKSEAWGTDFAVLKTWLANSSELLSLELFDLKLRVSGLKLLFFSKDLFGWFGKVVRVNWFWLCLSFSFFSIGVTFNSLEKSVLSLSGQSFLFL